MDFHPFVPIIRFVHVISAVVWAGGMIFLAFFLNPALKKQMADRERLLILARVAGTFKTGAWTAIFLLLVTGLMNLHEVYLEGKLSSPSYRLVIGSKIFLALLAMALSFAHDFFLGPAYAARIEKGTAGKLKPAVLWIARANLILVLIVIFLAEVAAHG